MIVYTVQHEAAWKAWKKQGYITSDNKWVDSYLKVPYRWMRHRMKQAIPSYQGEQLIWLWHTDNYPNRNEKCWGKTGERFVILTLEVPDCDILWSDYQVWCGLLNESISYQERIDEQTAEPFELWEKEMEMEYGIMFDFNALQDHPDWYLDIPNDIEKQGVVGMLPITAIKKVQRFREKALPKKYSKRVDSRTKRVNKKRRKAKERKLRLQERLRKI
ncbi:DUF3841 domain-containing protein [Bacillus cereus]|uniref:DUF3841 domain-containing protein n=1 Tax=Bacillus cereus TaxID=1396 RepID=UPI00382D89AB